MSSSCFNVCVALVLPTPACSMSPFFVTWPSSRAIRTGLLGLVEVFERCWAGNGVDRVAYCVFGSVIHLRPWALEDDGAVDGLLEAEPHAGGLAGLLDARYARAVLLDDAGAEQSARDGGVSQADSLCLLTS